MIQIKGFSGRCSYIKNYNQIIHFKKVNKNPLEASVI